jgi:hypothetical protein
MACARRPLPMFQAARRLDAWLMSAPTFVRVAVVLATLVTMAAASLPKVPRPAVDYSRLPVLNHIRQPDTFGTDTIADMYEARVVLNDVRDMYTKVKVDQTPIEVRTWSKEASAPYPPVSLLLEAGLYAAGEWTGAGFYGMILGLAGVFIGMSLRMFWTTRWYLFPILYLNFSYFSERFVHVQDSSYLIMLLVVIAALGLARRGSTGCHALMALAITIKLSPLYYAKNLVRMCRRDAAVFVAIVAAGLVLPIVIWENYLYIYRYGSELKGNWQTLAGAATFAIPFAVAAWYVETRGGFDLEDRVGWGLVPVAMFLGFKMNVARHLLVVLLVPDKRGVRNVAAAVGLAVPALLPGFVRFNSALPIAAGVLCLGLVGFLDTIGWDVVKDDLRHPLRTAALMLAARDRRPAEPRARPHV